MGIVFGAVQISWGIGGFLGPIVVGRLFDVTGRYNTAFITGAVVMLFTAGIVYVVRTSSAAATRSRLPIRLSCNL